MKRCSLTALDISEYHPIIPSTAAVCKCCCCGSTDLSMFIQQAMCVMDPLYWNEKNASMADQPVYLEASCLDAKGKAFSGAS